MHLRQWDDAAHWYARASPFLLRHEAHHNLLFGLGATLIRDPGRYRHFFLATVEDEGGVQLAALMTPPHPLIVSLTAAPAALACLADGLRAAYPALPGVNGPTAESGAFARLWHERMGQPYEKGMAQRIYALTEVRPVRGVSGNLRRATQADWHLLVAWTMAFAEEAEQLLRGAGEAERVVAIRLRGDMGGLFLWEDGGTPVALVGYSGPTPNGIRVGPVYTPPAHRRHGYARAAVAAVSQFLLDAGRRFCFLYTDLANPTSNHIYQQIGYAPVCDGDVYRFLPVNSEDTEHE